ncbi:MAG: DUF4147 domain-containing protein [Cenarchaeum sp. SB0662_bin_33]|nr:DUF4147 domain-containing protein [Cenarchaeum sp. SB0662_bin_33]
MVITNRAQVCDTRRVQDVIDILEAGLDAANPANIIPDFVQKDALYINDDWMSLDRYDNVYTIAFGKAADSMSRTVNRLLNVKSGVVIVPKDSKPQIRGNRFRLYRAGHPYPDRYSVAAAKDAIKFLSNRRHDDFVLFLVSGGASSLLALPDGITLSDKMHCTQALLQSGASISEINCVRKHISKIKGGRLLNHMKCHGASLIMSDVEGDNPDTIASGTTYMDSTTFDDALQIIERFNLASNIHNSIMDRLLDGAAGLIDETPKDQATPYQIIANNATCLKAMLRSAKDKGYDTNTTQQYGMIEDVADCLVKSAPQSGECLVFGGEPTVRVTGRGRGGRNQELVLRVAQMNANQSLIIASMGTDGIDGNTRVAGAIHRGLLQDRDLAASCIHDNDSFTYFERHNGLIKTGHTNTNLADIGLAISGHPRG